MNSKDLEAFALPAAIVIGAYLIYNKDKPISDQIPKNYDLGEKLGETTADLTAGAGAGFLGFVDGVSDTAANLVAQGLSTVTGLGVDAQDLKYAVKSFGSSPSPVAAISNVAEFGAGAVSGYLDSIAQKQFMTEFGDIAKNPSNVTPQQMKDLTSRINAFNKADKSFNVPAKAATVLKSSIATTKNPLIVTDKKILNGLKSVTSYDSLRGVVQKAVTADRNAVASASNKLQSNINQTQKNIKKSYSTVLKKLKVGS